jgi:VanZ family protein
VTLLSLRMRAVRVILWMVCAAYWVALFTLTHLPRVPAIGQRVQDKLAHFLAYGVLAGVLYVVLWASKSPRKRTAYFVVTVTLLYGAMDEITQPIVGRSCELDDWLADAAGVVLAVGVFASLRYVVERAGWRSPALDAATRDAA